MSILDNGSPGPQPHNQIAGTFAKQLQRAIEFETKRGTVPPDVGQGRPSPLPVRTQTFSFLMASDLPKVEWIIPDFLPCGLLLLAARPKSGKSWLALNLALAVSVGGLALDIFESNQVEVLYLSLEDSTRRLKARLAILSQLMQINPGSAAHFATSWLPDETGCVSRIVKLEEWLDSHPGVRFVIIDTLAAFRGIPIGNQDVYTRDYQFLSSIRHIAQRRHIAIMVIHHTRKAPSDHVLESISGSFGLSGAAETIWVLAPATESRGSRLHATGKDVESKTFDLEFQAASGLWSIQGDSMDYCPEQERVLKIILELNKPVTPKILAAMTLKSEPTIRRTLDRMVLAGKLRREHGTYAVREEAPATNCEYIRQPGEEG